MTRRARGELGGDAGGEGSGSGGNTLKRKRTGDVTSGEEPTPWLVVSSALHPGEASTLGDLSHDNPSNNTVQSVSSVTAHGADNTVPQDSGGDEDDENDGDGGDYACDVKDAKLESFPKRFFSWRELEEYLHEFGESTFQLFRKRTSVTVAVRNVSITRRIEARKDGGRNFKHPELIPDQWGYYSKTYVCTHGLKNHPRGGGLRTHTSVRDTGCTARIQTTLRFDQNALIYYISVRVTGSHNHPVSKEQYFSYAENRRITDPIVLRDIDEMSARGEFPKAILAHIAKRMRETSGEDCVYKLKDIRNIISRLKKERKELLAAQGANAVQQLSPTDVNGETAQQQAASAALSALASNLTQQTPAPAEISRNLLTAAVNGTEVSATNTLSKSNLSRLELLLDSPYSYRQAHNDIEQVVIAATEMIPNTISGFKHEVVQLPPSAPREEVAFVLPKHALAGCESGIVEYCGAKGLLPQSVGVTLPVTLPGSQEKRVSTLSSRQLVTMKRFHLARNSIAEAKLAVEWIKATSFSVFPSAPFDEYASYTKDLFVHALKLLPLTQSVIRGKNVDANAQFGFTDTIFGASLLKFSSHANIDVDCVKAALLHMHRRFYAKASFISPSFVLETDVRERCSRASTYGAFLHPKDFVAGLSQLQSHRWGGFFFDCSKKVCYLCAPTESEYEELQVTVGTLFRGLKVTVNFETSPGRPASTASNDSGILALLFVECMLLNTTWGDNPIDSFDYFRVRYLMQAIQVVNKQDVNEMSW